MDSTLQIANNINNIYSIFYISTYAYLIQLVRRNNILTYSNVLCICTNYATFIDICILDENELNNSVYIQNLIATQFNRVVWHASDYSVNIRIINAISTSVNRNLFSVCREIYGSINFLTIGKSGDDTIIVMSSNEEEWEFEFY